MTDLIDVTLDIAPGSRLAALRDERPEVKLRTQTSADALFHPDQPDGLTEGERFVAAWRVAAVNESRTLAVYYREQLTGTEDGAAYIAALDNGVSDRIDGRGSVILAHVERLAIRPAEARPAHLRTLRTAGLSTLAIVTLSQIVAFVSYQVRIAYGLNLLEKSR